MVFVQCLCLWVCVPQLVKLIAATRHRPDTSGGKGCSLFSRHCRFCLSGEWIWCQLTHCMSCMGSSFLGTLCGPEFGSCFLDQSSSWWFSSFYSPLEQGGLKEQKGTKNREIKKQLFHEDLNCVLLFLNHVLGFNGISVVWGNMNSFSFLAFRTELVSQGDLEIPSLTHYCATWYDVYKGEHWSWA